jgi:plastocyanin
MSEWQNVPVRGSSRPFVSRWHAATGRRVVVAVVVPLPLLLAACGGGDVVAPVRSYSIDLHTDDSGDEYAYVADDPIDVRVGDEVTFDVAITGTLIHDLQVVDPDGATIATAPPAGPDNSTTLTVLFDEPGFYRLNCLVDDHLTRHGMQAIIEVTDA